MFCGRGVQVGRRRASHLMVPRRRRSRLTHPMDMQILSIRTFALVVAAAVMACGDTQTSRTDASEEGRGTTPQMQEKDMSAPAPAAPPTARVGGVAGRVGFGAANEQA